MTAYIISKAIVVLGLATISVVSYIKTDGEIGSGWGVVAFLALLLM